jgi:hypothetical protein
MARTPLLKSLCRLSDLFSHRGLGLIHPGSTLVSTTVAPRRKRKKAGVVESLEVFGHAGLILNEPPRHSQVALPLVIRRLKV